jgi:hypothetical protein
MQLKENQVWVKFIGGKQLRDKFKDLCWAQNTSMTEKLLSFMEREVEENGKLLEEMRELRNK